MTIVHRQGSLSTVLPELSTVLAAVDELLSKQAPLYMGDISDSRTVIKCER
jgi:hypothetical protein